VADKLTNNVATIGENQQLRRIKHVAVSNGVVVPYMHNAAATNLGKIGVLVALESKPAPTCWSRWASRSRCTSPPLSRWR
jgi:elongation factor Ts